MTAWADTLLAAAGMGGAALLAAALIVLAAAMVRGYAGFGFSAIVVAAMSLFMPTREVVPLVFLMEIIISLQMVRQVWHDINWRLVLFILAGMVLFSPVGQFFLRWLDVEAMRLVAALLLLLAIVFVARGGFSGMRRLTSWLLAGAVGGFMNGMLAMGGMWVMIFLINSGAAAAVLRASLVALFLASDSYALGIAWHYGLFDETSLWRVACLLPFIFAGVAVGSRRFSRGRQESYKKIVLALLAFLALLLIARTAVAAL